MILYRSSSCKYLSIEYSRVYTKRLSPERSPLQLLGERDGDFFYFFLESTDSLKLESICYS